MPVNQWVLSTPQLLALEAAHDAVPDPVKNPKPADDTWRDFDATGDGQLSAEDVIALYAKGDTDTIAALKDYLNNSNNTVLVDPSTRNTAQNLQSLAELLSQAKPISEADKQLNTVLTTFLKNTPQVGKMNWGGLPPAAALSTAGLELLGKPEVTPEQRTAYHKSLNVLIATVAAQVQGGNASLKPTLDALRELRSKFEAKFPDHSNRFEGFDVPALTEQLKSSDPNVQKAAQQQLRALYGVANEALQEAESKGDQAGADKARAKLNEIFSSIAGIDPSKLPPELKTAALSVAFNPDPRTEEGQLLAKFDKVGGDHKITPADLAKMSPQEISELAGLLKPDAKGNLPLSPETTKQLFHLLASYANDSKNNWNNKGELSTNNQGSPPKALSLSFKGPDGAFITINAPEGPTGWELPSGITDTGPSLTFEDLVAGAAI